ncbi:MAG TPA: hypothetical protein VLH35_08915 [Candidatus Acidoferrales bacterium]|nr:hypothetical protein [Candidatus Acidoferrales bacterium]
MITAGSPAFQQILKDCLENGVPCQIQIRPKENTEALIHKYYKDTAVECPSCHKTSIGEEAVCICTKPQPCYHTINNGKIAAIDIGKSDALKYFLFYYAVTFTNKLRPKNDELIAIVMDENGKTLQNFDEANLLGNEALELIDGRSKLKPELFDQLKAAADKKLSAILQEKVRLYDLPLTKEKRAKIKSFERRLRRERREQVISKKHDFDYVKWQSNYEALLKREEEASTTGIAARFINLLVVSTYKVKFEVNLDNKATIPGSFIMGITQPQQATCPICHSTFTEGYVTQDGQYVCPSCIRQSVDTGKFYSKKANLALDEKLNEYLERDGGFVCKVCGKKHSKLLEIKCSHDNSSVCIYHYGTCDVCGKVFSKLNLTYTDEFKRKLCPKHAKSKEA